MGTGWRRAFCTSIPRDPESAAAPEKPQNHRRVRQQLSPSSSPGNLSRSPGSCAKFGVFSGGGGGSSNPASLRLRCRTADASSEHPLLSPALDNTSGRHCKNGDFTTPDTPPPPPAAAASAGVKGSPRLVLTRSNPASPRSPSKFALLKATLRLSRTRCGICSQSVRTAQKTAVFTAECSHSFHFPCISTHVRTQSRNHSGSLSCPVCSASWREVPLLSSPHPQSPLPPPSDFNNTNETTKARIPRSGENDSKQLGNNNKLYDDDEPLLLSSSTQGAALHFNPIPEADLEDEVEGGISYGRNEVEIGGGGVEVVVSPEAAAAALLSADRNHQNYVILLRVKAPAFAQRSVTTVAASVLDPSCRAPIDLVTVLDVSGSMASAAKLQMLKRAMRLLISSLGASDRLSIVAFSAGAKRLLPLVRMSRQGQRSARQIVDRLIVCGGAGDNGVQGDCRCIAHALRKATKVLEDRRERNPVATIMLLSDSHQEQNRAGKEGSSGSSPRIREEEDGAEKHLRNPIPSSTETAATRFAHLEIPIGGSTDLTGGVVNQVEDVFSKCVSGLVSLVLQDVHLQLNFPSSSFVSSIYSTAGGGEGYVGLALSKGQGGNGAVSIRLGDFYAEEKRELLVELRVPAAPPPPQQRSDLLSYKCCYRDPTSRELVLCKEKSIAFPSLRQISPAAVSSRELRNLFIATRALVESRRLADHNELEAAAHLLSTARSLLIQSNSAAPSHHQKYVASLEMRLSEVHRRHRRRQVPSSSATATARPSEQLTPTSAWRAAEQLAKVAILRKSMSRVGDLHGFENARF